MEKGINKMIIFILIACVIYISKLAYESLIEKEKSNERNKDIPFTKRILAIVILSAQFCLIRNFIGIGLYQKPLFPYEIRDIFHLVLLFLYAILFIKVSDKYKMCFKVLSLIYTNILVFFIYGGIGF